VVTAVDGRDPDDAIIGGRIEGRGGGAVIADGGDEGQAARLGLSHGRLDEGVARADEADVDHLHPAFDHPGQGLGQGGGGSTGRAAAIDVGDPEGRAGGGAREVRCAADHQGGDGEAMAAHARRPGEATLGHARPDESRVGGLDPGVDQAEAGGTGGLSRGGGGRRRRGFERARRLVHMVEGVVSRRVEPLQPLQRQPKRTAARRGEDDGGQVQRLEPFLAHDGEAFGEGGAAGLGAHADGDQFAADDGPALRIGLQRPA